MTRLFAWIKLRTSEFWRQVVTLALGFAGSVQALISLERGLHIWQVATLLALVFVTLGAVKFIWADERKRAPLLVKSREGLVDDNIRWLGEQGHAVIVTRDMSWANDARLEVLLRNKAKASDLTIVAAKETARLTRLQHLGASIIVRSDIPTVRFTALRFGASDCTVLVHHQQDGLVHFRQYTRTDFPVYWLCQDLIKIYISGG